MKRKKTRAKPDYESFKRQIAKALKGKTRGLTWTEIKYKLGLPQKVPNNRWVRWMEKDIGLTREHVSGRGVVWRLRK